MNRPTTIQIAAETSVSSPSETIMDEQTKIPRMGTKGTRGVLNGLTASGFLTRSTQIPTHTSTNANKVPKLVKSPATLPGTNPANNPTNTNKRRFDLNGVRNVGCSSENTFGTSPSFDME